MGFSNVDSISSWLFMGYFSLSKFCHRLDANSTVSTTVEVPQPSEKNDNDEKNEHDFTYSHGSGIDPNIAEPKL